MKITPRKRSNCSRSDVCTWKYLEKGEVAHETYFQKNHIYIEILARPNGLWHITYHSFWPSNKIFSRLLAMPVPKMNGAAGSMENNQVARTPAMLPPMASALRHRTWRDKKTYTYWCLVAHRIHGAGIYANIGGILMVNVTIYTIHGSYG